jgi:hypothetical protein
MYKKNERLIYMAEAHIIPGKNYFDGNVKIQEKEENKMFYLLGRIPFSILYLRIKKTLVFIIHGHHVKTN